MQTNSKLGLGVTIVSTGLAAAMCFRKEVFPSGGTREAPVQSAAALPRRLAGVLVSPDGDDSRSTLRPPAASPPASSPSTAIIADSRRSQKMGASTDEPIVGFPAVSLQPIELLDRTHAQPPQSSPGSKAQASLDARPITHIIADGDTLARLAERYLGSGSVHDMLFELNRDILASPDVLPIGKTLKIPPRSAALHAAGRLEEAEAPPPLVPVR